jgi:hypothetical protein
MICDSFRSYRLGTGMMQDLSKLIVCSSLLAVDRNKSPAIVDFFRMTRFKIQPIAPPRITESPCRRLCILNDQKLQGKRVAWPPLLDMAHAGRDGIFSSTLESALDSNGTSSWRKSWHGDFRRPDVTAIPGATPDPRRGRSRRRLPTARTL